MNPLSDTPRTDEEDDFHNGYASMLDFARQLERETATLHAQIASLQQREGELVGALKALVGETHNLHLKEQARAALQEGKQ